MNKSPLKKPSNDKVRRKSNNAAFTNKDETNSQGTFSKQISQSKMGKGPQNDDFIQHTYSLKGASAEKKLDEAMANLPKANQTIVQEKRKSVISKKSTSPLESKGSDSPKKKITFAVDQSVKKPQEDKKEETNNNITSEDNPPSVSEINKNTTSLPTASNLAVLTQEAAIASNSSNRNTNIRVYARVRPLNEVEKELLENGVGSLCIEYQSNSKKSNSIVVRNPNGNASNPYIFDNVFPSESHQVGVYNVIGKEIVKDVLAGYNGTIFAYGQSGSGKTFTMYGSDIYNEDTKGIIPRLISDIFNHVDTAGENVTFQFKMSILQIYKEVIYDLLTGDKDLKIKENPIKGIYVDKLTEVYVNTIENFMEYIDLAQDNRIVSETRLNNSSSRSHSILIFEVTQTVLNENFSKKGTLNLVDLAGSEKISKTGAVGETLEEAKKINLSLSALGHVIHSLTSGADHIPYRDSKLTRILQESLGGNFKTSLVVTCSPHSYHLEETLSSLQFAQRAKTIKNRAKLNIKLTYDELQKIITQLRKSLEKANNEILRLKALLPPGTEVYLPIAEETIETNKTFALNNILTEVTEKKENDISDLLEEEDLTIPNNTKGAICEEIASDNDLSHNNDNSDIGKVKSKYQTPNKAERKDEITNQHMFESKAQTHKPKSKSKDTYDIKDIEKFDNKIKDKTKPESNSKDIGQETITSTTEHHPTIVEETKCANCSRLLNKIKTLKNSIELLNNEVKEKDDVISTLEKKSLSMEKQIEQLKVKAPLSRLFKHDKNDSNFQFKTLNELYDEIKLKLTNIKKKQTDSTNLDIKLSSFSDMNDNITKNLQLIFEKNIKNTFEHSSNGHLLLLDNVTSILSKSLGIYKDESTSDMDYGSISEVYKDKTGNMFDSIFQLFQKEINSRSPPSGKAISNKLVHFTSLFIFGFIEAYANLQISNQLNYKINNQNKIMKNINLILTTIVEDLIKSNLDISQKYNNIGLEKLKASIAETGGYNMTFAGETQFLDNINKQSFHNDLIFPVSQTFQRKKGKIMTSVSRKGMDTNKAAKERFENQNFNSINVNTFGATSFINVINCSSETSDAKGNLAESVNIDNNNNNRPIEGRVPKRTHSGLTQILIPCSNMAGVIKKQEKKKSKLTMLKEFVIKSIKQTDDYKRDINILKEHFCNIIKLTQKSMLTKLYENGVIQEKDIELEISTEQILNQMKSNHFDFNEDYENENDSSPKKSVMNMKLSKKANSEKTTFQVTDESHGLISERRLPTITSDINFRKSDITPITTKIHKNVSYDFINSGMRKMTIYKPNNIESLIAEYLETGTATRKFDGIAVQYINHIPKCSYNGGLNANNQIETIPIQTQLECNAGDNSLLSFDDNEEDNQ